MRRRRGGSAHLDGCRLFWRRSSKRKGVALAEFALILPVFILIVLASIEACSMIFLQQSVEIIAYEGARVALVPGSDEGNVQGACQLMIDGRKIKGASVIVTPNDFETQPYGTFVAVNISVPADQNGLFPSWFYSGKHISGRVEMMKEY